MGPEEELITHLDLQWMYVDEPAECSHNSNIQVILLHAVEGMKLNMETTLG